MGHVNNVTYLRWVQDAATAHWTRPRAREDQAKLLWIVLRHEIDYKQAALREERSSREPGSGRRSACGSSDSPKSCGRATAGAGRRRRRYGVPSMRQNLSHFGQRRSPGECSQKETGLGAGVDNEYMTHMQSVDDFLESDQRLRGSRRFAKAQGFLAVAIPRVCGERIRCCAGESRGAGNRRATLLCPVQEISPPVD